MRILFSAILLLSLAASGRAQNPFFEPLAQVGQYLALSVAQVQSILQNNNAYNQFSQERQARLRQVQVDIAGQTAARPLDPMALGQSYAEIETICRQLKDRAAEVQKSNVALLTDAQRTKLQALEDALKLMPVISEAQSSGLMAAGNSSPYALTGTYLGGYSYANVLMGAIAAAPGCTSSSSVLTGIIRPGNRIPAP